MAFLKIPSPTIAEQHAQVRFFGKGWDILDDESSSGLFVNGEQVSLRELHDGDELRLGDVRLRVLLDPVEPELRLVAAGGLHADLHPARSPKGCLKASRAEAVPG
jgi:predicted component of type VI protein secretion system